MEIFDVLRQSLPTAIIGFRGAYHWLAMDSDAPVVFEGVTYPSVLNALVAAASTSKSFRERARITKDATSLRAMLRNPEEMSPTFHARKPEILAELLQQKFRDPELRGKLCETGKAKLVYENQNGDTFFGVSGSQGYNVLGQLLMLVREQVIAEDSRIYSGPVK